MAQRPGSTLDDLLAEADRLAQPVSGAPPTASRQLDLDALLGEADRLIGAAPPTARPPTRPATPSPTVRPPTAKQLDPRPTPDEQLIIEGAQPHQTRTPDPLNIPDPDFVVPGGLAQPTTGEIAIPPGGFQTRPRPAATFTERMVEGLTEQGPIRGAVETARGFATGAAGIAQGLGRTAEMAGRWMGGTDEGWSPASLVTQGGRQTAEFAEAFTAGAQDLYRKAGYNPDEMAVDILDDPSKLADPNWWLYNGTSALGSALAFFAPMSAGGQAVGALGKLANWTAKTKAAVSSIGGVTAGASVESLVEAGLAYEDAIKAGRTPEEAAEIASGVAAKNLALIMVTGAAGYTLPKVTNPSETVARLGAMFMEGAQEAGQEVIQNVGAQAYDPTRETMQGVGTSALMGGLIGGALGGRGPSVQEPADLGAEGVGQPAADIPLAATPTTGDEIALTLRGEPSGETSDLDLLLEQADAIVAEPPQPAAAAISAPPGDVVEPVALAPAPPLDVAAPAEAPTLDETLADVDALLSQDPRDPPVLPPAQAPIAPSAEADPFANLGPLPEERPGTFTPDVQRAEAIALASDPAIVEGAKAMEARARERGMSTDARKQAAAALVGQEDAGILAPPPSPVQPAEGAAPAPRVTEAAEPRLERTAPPAGAAVAPIQPKPKTPQLPPPGGGTGYVLPSFVTQQQKPATEPTADVPRGTSVQPRAEEPADFRPLATKTVKGEKVGAIRTLAPGTAVEYRDGKTWRAATVQEAVDTKIGPRYAVTFQGNMREDPPGSPKRALVTNRNLEDVRLPDEPLAPKAQQAQTTEQEPGDARTPRADRPGAVPPSVPAEPVRAAGAEPLATVPAEPRDRPATGEPPRAGSAGRGVEDGGAAGPMEGGRAPRRPDRRTGEGPALDAGTRLDYTIPGDEALIAGGPKARLDANLAALKLVKTLQAEGRRATPDEQATLAKFTGFGMTELAKAVGEAAPETPAGKALRAHIEATLSPAELKSIRGTILNAHYTFSQLPRTIWSALERMGFTGGRVLEPSMGAGHFFGTMPAHLRTASRLYGVEIDPLTAAIGQQLYQTAHVQGVGLEKAKLPPAYFDVAIGNVPFGNYAVVDPAFTKGARQPLARSIHDYFFAKTLDHLRPGGVMAFITSRYTMDKKDSVVRDYLAERADFLGAVRLPRQAFKATAGTEVVTDILFFRKRPEGAPPQHAAKWAAVREQRYAGKEPWQTFPFAVNEYFLDHPEQVVGAPSAKGKMQTGVDYTVDLEGELAPAVEKALQALPSGAFGVVPASPAVTAEGPVLASQDAKEGEFTVQPNGRVMVTVGGNLQPTQISAADAGRVRAFVTLRDSYRTLLKALVEHGTDTEVAKAQKSLKSSYDAFVTRYGSLNARANTRVLKGDPEAARLFPLEKIEWTQAKRGAPRVPRVVGLADIFTQRTISAPAEPATADTGRDALVQSLTWRGRIDLPYMASLRGVSEAALIAELGNVEMFRDPITEVWVPRDAFLSGDVVGKLESAEAKAGTDPSWKPAVEALEAVQPKKLEPEDLDIRLGAAWVPHEVYKAFAAHELRVEPSEIRIGFVNTEAITSWSVQAMTAKAARMADSHELNMEGWRFFDLVEAAMNLAQPVLKDRDGQARPAETAALREAIRQVDERFRAWWAEDHERAERLTDLYNRTFNRTVLREFDGRHLALPGSNPQIALRAHQKNVIWRILQAGNTLMAHAVGAGKTFAMIGAAMEMRRLGLARKPLITIPNHMLEQWKGDIEKLYPAAKILVPDPEDSTTGARQRFMGKIASGDWDVVLLTHSAFERLPVSPEAFRAFIDEQVSQLETFLRESTSSDDKRTAKQIQAAIKRLEAKLEKRLKAWEKDQTLTFEQLGVDALFVDEAHLFKNLFFSTKLTRVAGLSQSESDRAIDMFLKVRQMNRLTNSRGVVFATGTPVANAVSELFTMQRYLAMDTLEGLGLSNFDNWKNQFADVIEQAEPAPEGGYRTRSRLRKYSNAAELITLFRQFADVHTAEDLKLPVPKLRRGRATLVTSEPPAMFGEFLATLRERVMKIRSRQVDPSTDNMLKVTGDASAAAVDMRLVDPSAPDDPNGRLHKVADRITEIDERWRAKKGTQLVFLDIGVPTGKELEPLPLKKLETTADDLLADEAAEVDEAPPPPEPSHRNLYADLKKKLVARGIPAEKIAFIHQAKTNAEKRALFAAVNAGDIRVLIASSSKGGVGTNVQERLVALHNVDVPWRPADLEQREGRIIRQGNRFYAEDPEGFEVEIVRYLTRGSFDEYRWGLLATKQAFISQLLRGKLNVRTFEDTDPSQLSFEEAAAAASGDPRTMELLGLRQSLARLEAKATLAEKRRRKALSSVQGLESQRTTWLRMAKALPDFGAKLAAEGGTVTVGGKGYALDDSDARAALQGALEKAVRAAVKAIPESARESRTIGSVGDGLYEVHVSVNGSYNYQSRVFERFATVQLTPVKAWDGIASAVGHSTPPWDLAAAPDKPPSWVRSFDARLKDAQWVTDLATGYAERADEAEKTMALERGVAKRAFAERDELDRVRARVTELEKAMAAPEVPPKPPDDEPPGGDAQFPIQGATSGARGRRQTGPTLPPPAAQATIPATPRAKPSDIVDRLARLFDVPVRERRFRARAWGLFQKEAGVIRTRIANDLPILAHEFGHAAESFLPFKLKDPAWNGELLALGQATAKPNATGADQRREGLAEFFRLWVLDPRRAEREAPEFQKAFERWVDGGHDMGKGLREVQRDAQAYLAQDAVGRVRLHLDFDGTGTTKASWFSGFQKRMVDDLRALENAVTAMAGGHPLPAVLNAYTLARNAKGASARAQTYLEDGVRDHNGQFLGGSLADAIKDVRKDLDAFAVYLTAKRAVELHGRNIETGLTDAEAEQAVTDVETGPNGPRFMAARDKVYAFQDAMLLYAKRAGALGADQIAAMKALNENYVPFQRVMAAVEDPVKAGLARRIANRIVPIKAIKGSGRDIVNPLESIVTNAFALVDMVEKNRAMEALTAQADATPGGGKFLQKVETPQLPKSINLREVLEAYYGPNDPALADLKLTGDEFVTLFSPAFKGPAGENLVTVVREGKRVYYQVQDPDLYEAITQMAPQLSEVAALANVFTGVLRAGATLTLSFITRNPARDTLTAFLQSRHGFIPLYDTVRGMVKLVLHQAGLRTDDDVTQFFASGVAQAAFTGADRKRAQKALQTLAHNRSMVRNPLDLLRALTEFSEAATRVAEFELALRAGGLERGILGRLRGGTTRTVNADTLAVATLAARDVTTDFSRSGTFARELNALSAFFNARVHGYVRIAETIKRDPTTTAVNVAALGTVSLLLYLLHADDDDYKNLEPWERQTYWHFKVPGVDGFVRVPKPFEWAFVPNLVEAAAMWAKEKDPRAWDVASHQVAESARQLFFGFVPSAILPPLEAAMNYSTFRQAPIVGHWDQNLPLEQQASDWTSATAKKLTQLGVPLAPAVIDHLIFGFTGGLGRMAVEFGTDPALQALGVVPKRRTQPAMRSERYPGIGAYLRDAAPTSRAPALVALYEAVDQMAGAKRGANKAESRDQLARIKAGVQGQAWVGREEAIKAGKKRIDDLSDDVDRVYADVQMTPAQKAEALGRLRREMVRVAEIALGWRRRTP